MWMGNQEADRSTTKLGWQFSNTRWIGIFRRAIAQLGGDHRERRVQNLSGQVYKAIVFPSMTVITRTGLERLQAFVKAGGKAIFVGKTPGLVVDKTFLNTKDVPDLSFATLIEPSGDITPA